MNVSFLEWWILGYRESQPIWLWKTVNQYSLTHPHFFHDPKQLSKTWDGVKKD
tara:strand:+ start:374 stop:532 length:159 start_codon:yes stop_codon:yes gene_type:complete